MIMMTKIVGFALCLTAAAMAVGCGPDRKKARVSASIPAKYEPLPPKDVPAWLKGSIYEQCDLAATEPLRASAFSLVTGLKGTGDALNVSNAVRDYMLRQMTKRGFGSANQPGFENVSPERVLADPRVAIVRVDGFIPPGAKQGDRIDLVVSALDDNDTSSLSGGYLYQCDLSPIGAIESAPGDLVNVLAVGRGPLFVNPAYALSPDLKDPAQRRSLRQAIVPNGGMVKIDRPLALRIRSAEARIARATEYRLDQQFHSRDCASAQDEGVVFVRVPAAYGRDWEHFAGVMLHTFYNSSDEFAVLKARELVEAAKQPEAPLANLTYAMEALGRPALPIISELYTHGSHDVAYAAARAGAFIGDPAAEKVLVQIAQDPTNAFNVEATQTLGKLPRSAQIARELRRLLEAPQTLVRVEAYRALAEARDGAIYSRPIGDKFFLEVIECDAPPLVYASRLGTPRIAVIGRPAELKPGILFTEMNDRFSISAQSRNDNVFLFYRGDPGSGAVRVPSRRSLPEVVGRLGGEGPAGEARFNFTYGEVVALVSKLADAGLIVEAGPAADQLAAFHLQELPGVAGDYESAPPIAPDQRPISSQSDSTPVSSRN